MIGKSLEGDVLTSMFMSTNDQVTSLLEVVEVLAMEDKLTSVEVVVKVSVKVFLMMFVRDISRVCSPSNGSHRSAIVLLVPWAVSL